MRHAPFRRQIQTLAAMAGAQGAIELLDETGESIRLEGPIGGT